MVERADLQEAYVGQVEQSLSRGDAAGARHLLSLAAQEGLDPRAVYDQAASEVPERFLPCPTWAEVAPQSADSPAPAAEPEPEELVPSE